MDNELEEEFFRIEGRRPGVEACRYVESLRTAPDGDRISAAERAALWYIAFWSMDGAAHVSVAALSMQLDLGLRETRRVLSALIDKQILRAMNDPLDWYREDGHVYEFVQMMASRAAEARNG
jgi:hypothetical protein